MNRPELWLVAGPNGAGKTTAMNSERIRSLLGHVHFLNADDRTLEKLRAAGWKTFANVPEQQLEVIFVEAATEVFDEIAQIIEAAGAVGSETVLSTHKYRPVVERVKQLGGIFGLIYVGLRDADVSARRVAARVRQGGHDVPTGKLSGRWLRSVSNLGWYARQADVFFVFDNSDSTSDTPPLLIAEGGCGEVCIMDPDAIPEITAVLKAAFSDGA